MSISDESEREVPYLLERQRVYNEVQRSLWKLTDLRSNSCNFFWFVVFILRFDTKKLVRQWLYFRLILREQVVWNITSPYKRISRQDIWDLHLMYIYAYGWTDRSVCMFVCVFKKVFRQPTPDPLCPTLTPLFFSFLNSFVIYVWIHVMVQCCWPTQPASFLSIHLAVCQASCSARKLTLDVARKLFIRNHSNIPYFLVPVSRYQFSPIHTK